jgi:RND family efflux transporter MFP subunit
VIVPLLICLGVFGAVLAQEMPPTPVRYTEAREHEVQKVLTLPGSVESPTVSLVASEVEGLVARLKAREGDVVRRGEPLAMLRTTSHEIRLRASEAQLEEAEARLKLAELSLERARRLHGEKILSQQGLDDAFYEHNAWQGRVERLGAEIQQIQHDLERSVIRAPFAGTVVSKRTEVGEWLDVGSPVVEIISLAVLEVRVDVPERYYDSLRPNASAAVTFDSLPDYEVKGRVSAIIPRADPQARTFPVKVRLENTEGRIGVGMLAQVSVPAGETYRAIVVPKDAVIRQGIAEVLFRMDGDSSVELVTIVTGAGVGSWIAVNGPIEAGHKVITRGNERLSPGQTVQGEPLEYSLP